MEESHHGLTYLFRHAGYRNNGRNPRKLSWARVPVKIFPVAQKIITAKKRHKKRNFPERTVQEVSSQIRTLSRVRISLEMLTLSIIRFVGPILGYVSNDEAYGV